MLRVQLTHDGNFYNSAADLSAAVFDGSINPGEIDVVRDIVIEDDGSTDTAVFAQALADYSIANLGDGYYQVQDNVGDDGLDVVRNMEELQFADACLIVDAAEDPTAWAACAPLGVVEIAAKAGSVTATVIFEDENGEQTVANPESVRFNWQDAEALAPSPSVDSMPEPSADNTDTFTPSDGDGASTIRVVVTFEDDEGVLRSITSEVLPTD
ncbi:hypothetical protein [Ornithinimicrobium sp. INDO-MA30-4]|uniref:hypothetical protein n=1 Tax=Ornithinimicrobium sp. INDO-MA30-4 TaxID=2908651 RepID=UPI001F340232|nr:hypothetical protein [Ornithinimicrobium sp. INDO-MA30-4]UJH70035.1 hypothetical protein L0A91_12565 [Ornithinimicrobium sp. INDO-MA30-4]